MKNPKFPLQLAKEAILLQRYWDAVRLVKPLSRNGNVDAQFLHGYLYFWDDDLDRSDAINLIHTAANAGHAEANYILAVCPDLMPGYAFQLPTNEQQIRHLQRAVAYGSDAAHIDLAQCYLEGIYVAQDTNLARELLAEAYERGIRYQNYPKCCFLLGRMLLDGVGGEQNIDEGLRALARCQYRFGDPFAVAALELFLDTIRNEKYAISASSQESLREEFEPNLEQLRSTTIPRWQHYIEYQCLNTLTYDLVDTDLDGFVSFLFEHFDQPKNDRAAFQWDYSAEVIFDARQIIQHYIALFNEPTFLLEHYTRDEIERAFWTMRDGRDWSVACSIQNAENSLDDAEACIRSMYNLYSGLFTQISFDTIDYMWWEDGLYAAMCSNSSHGQRIEKRQMEKLDYKRLGEATFDTLTRILQLQSGNCRAAAIHGLNHFSHPDKERVLLRFIEDNPELSDRDRSFVMAAIRGELL
jgi:hypothetical protein